MRAIYLNRDLVASLPAVGLAVFLMAMGVKEVRTLTPKYDEPVKLEIIDIADIPPPPAPPQPVVKPPEPKPEPKSEPKPEPKPEPKQQPQPEPKPEPLPTSEPQPAPPRPAQPAPQPPQPERPPQPPVQATPAPQPNIEAEFIGRMRAYLNSIKRYPTGREASLQRPRGTVKVWFVLRRDGTLVDAGVEKSSNVMLLDEAARKTITRAEPQPFPDQFKPGEATHRFTVELEFKPAG